MLIELALCTLVWIKEFRYPALLLGFLLHLGIECTLIFIPLLQYLMIASYLLFIEPAHLSKAIDYIKSLLRTLLRPLSQHLLKLTYSV